MKLPGMDKVCPLRGCRHIAIGGRMHVIRNTLHYLTQRITNQTFAFGGCEASARDLRLHLSCVSKTMSMQQHLKMGETEVDKDFKALKMSDNWAISGWKHSEKVNFLWWNMEFCAPLCEVVWKMKKGWLKTWENVFVRVNLLQAPQIFAVTLCNTLIYLLHTAGPSIIKAGYATGKKHKIATRS